MGGEYAELDLGLKMVQSLVRNRLNLEDDAQDIDSQLNDESQANQYQPQPLEAAPQENQSERSFSTQNSQFVMEPVETRLNKINELYKHKRE